MTSMKDVEPGMTAQSLRENAPSAELAARVELANWLKQIYDASHCKRNGIYINVLTVPTDIRDAVMAELRERGFWVSAVLEGSVRYDAAGSAFVVRWVYVDWRNEPQR